jgi:serine phosphatase RsbU (regulator of sigma subunit)
MITDGFFEAANPAGGMYGIDRVRQCLASADGGTSEGMIGRLHDEVAAFVGSASQRDDMTAVIIQRLRGSSVQMKSPATARASSSVAAHH